jgi:hypothetical protein
MKKKVEPRANKVIRFGKDEWKDLTAYANKYWRGNASHAVRYLVMFGLQQSKEKNVNVN